MSKMIKAHENKFSRGFLSSMRKNGLPANPGDAFVSAELASVLRENLDKGTLPQQMLHIGILIIESKEFPFTFADQTIHGFFLDFKGRPKLLLFGEGGNETQS